MKHATGMETCTKIYFLFIFNLQGPRSNFLSVGPVTASFELGRGFRTVRLLNLSWVIVDRSHVHKFQAAEKYLSPAEPDCTRRIHQ